MKDLVKDKNGKVCGAKVAYMLTLLVCLAKVLLSGVVYGEISFGVADFSGMALFIAPIGAVYFGRSHDKEQ